MENLFLTFDSKFTDIYIIEVLNYDDNNIVEYLKNTHYKNNKKYYKYLINILQTYKYIDIKISLKKKHFI